MAFLVPDQVLNVKIGNNPLTINVKITPDGARATKYICSYIQKGDLVKPNRPLNNGNGPKGITVHNTAYIQVAAGTNPAEQYARATYPNGNMKGVAVHYYVYEEHIWQQLRDDEQGWHAADGSTRRSSHRAGQMIGGNLDTIAIECIADNKKSEDTTAKLVAYLCKKYGFDPDLDVYTHNYFYSKKYCPLYILPHWSSFMNNVRTYFNGGSISGGGSSSGGNTSGGGSTGGVSGNITVGSKVRVKQGAKTYTGGGMASFVYSRDHVVSEISGDRAVITYSGVIVAAVHVSDLTLVGGSGVTPPPSNTGTIIVGSMVKVKSGAKSYTGQSIASFVFNGTYRVDELKGDRAVLDMTGICTPFKVSDLILVSGGGSTGGSSSSGGNYSSGSGSSNSGSIKVGSMVKVKSGAKSYSGQSIASFVFNNTYRVDELKGDRAVLDSKGLCTAFKVSDLILVSGGGSTGGSSSSSTSKTVKVGSKVRVKRGAKSYTGQSIASFVYDKTYTVDELKGDRAVLDLKGLCTAFKVSDLTVV